MTDSPFPSHPAFQGIQVVQGNDAPDGGPVSTRTDLEDWELNRQALERANERRDWNEALRILIYLGNKDGNLEAYRAMAQAAWLALKGTADVAHVVLTLYNLLVSVGPRHAAAGPLASLANLMCQLRTPNHPEAELARIQAQQMLRYVGDAHRLESQEEFEAWVRDQRLDDPDHFVPIALELIEGMVGWEWWIDREGIQREMEAANQGRQPGG